MPLESTRKARRRFFSNLQAQETQKWILALWIAKEAAAAPCFAARINPLAMTENAQNGDSRGWAVFKADMGLANGGGLLEKLTGLSLCAMGLFQAHSDAEVYQRSKGSSPQAKLSKIKPFAPWVIVILVGLLALLH